MRKYDFDLDLETFNTMSVIVNQISDNSKVLEFGPAHGRLTKHLNTIKKCDIDIVEIDEEAGKEAAKFATAAYIGLYKGNIENYFWEKTEYKYDYIIFSDVLEHLYNPKEVLRRAVRLLKVSGKILVSIPNISHNSVIIDLIKDEFRYLATGLLDETHIRFFTYNSFKRLLNELNLVSTLEIPIYSRVGFNEIQNNYTDVSWGMEKELRKRPEGSVYQYVFELEPLNRTEKKSVEIDIKQLDRYPECEAVIYVKAKGQEAFNEEMTSRMIYTSDKMCLTMDLSRFDKIDELRFDPATENMVYLLENTEIKVKDNWYSIQPVGSNAIAQINNLFFFETKDPQIYLRPQIENIDQIKLEFKILEYRITNYSKYDYFFREIQKEKELKTKYLQKIIDTRDFDIKQVNREIVLRDGIIQKNNVVINHRDKDIKELKEVINHRDKDIKELKEVINHQDQDLKTLRTMLKENSDRLEEVIKELDEIKGKKVYKILSKFKR